MLNYANNCTSPSKKKKTQKFSNNHCNHNPFDYLQTTRQHNELLTPVDLFAEKFSLARLRNGRTLIGWNSSRRESVAATFEMRFVYLVVYCVCVICRGFRGFARRAQGHVRLMKVRIWIVDWFCTHRLCILKISKRKKSGFDFFFEFDLFFVWMLDFFCREDFFFGSYIIFVFEMFIGLICILN